MTCHFTSESFGTPILDVSEEGELAPDVSKELPDFDWLLYAVNDINRSNNNCYTRFYRNSETKVKVSSSMLCYKIVLATNK